MAFVAVWLATIFPAAGQARPAAGAQGTAYAVPRTPWGHPDLQGTWDIATRTPLERPAAFADREFITEEEAAKLDAQAQAVLDNGNTRVDQPTGTYNAFWREPGTWSTRTSLIVDPSNGRIPPLTPQALARRDARRVGRGDNAASWDELGLWSRCLTRSLPLMPAAYNNNYQILQTPGHVVILMEMIHEARVIPLDGRPHVGPAVRQWLGDSRGRWDGNTLVVTTTNFTDKTSFQGSSEDLQLVERFTRTSNDVISYEFTVNDPATFTRPWTVGVPMNKADGQIFEYACHEGNYAVEGILKGARAAEAKAGEQR
jgi:hypothetical protein